jgi:hypothetical protein
LANCSLGSHSCRHYVARGYPLKRSSAGQHLKVGASTAACTTSLTCAYVGPSWYVTPAKWRAQMWLIFVIIAFLEFQRSRQGPSLWSSFRLAPSEAAGGQGQDRTVDLPLFRRSVIPRALTWRKPPTAQPTGVYAADRLFSVSLTRITSVPECAVSSVGFLWGSAAVSLSCGVLWGSPKPLTGLADPHGYPSPADLRILMITFR